MFISPFPVISFASYNFIKTENFYFSTFNLCLYLSRYHRKFRKTSFIFSSISICHFHCICQDYKLRPTYYHSSSLSLIYSSISDTYSKKSKGFMRHPCRRPLHILNLSISGRSLIIRSLCARIHKLLLRLTTY